MSERDKELDALLQPLRDVQPQKSQLASWQKSLQQQANSIRYLSKEKSQNKNIHGIPSSRTAIRRANVIRDIIKIGIAAAMGFAMGAAYFSSEKATSSTEVANLTDSDGGSATVEYVFAKSE